MKIFPLKAALISLVCLLAFIVLSGDVRQIQFLSPAAHCDEGDRDGCIAITQPPVAYQDRPSDANGNVAGFVVSSKTGARARVGLRYAAQFQAYIDDLEKNHDVRVLFMGGIRRGGCSLSSEHPCGKALDVCQLRRGVVDARCKLPARATLG